MATVPDRAANRLSTLKERAAIIQATRSFFIEQGFLEVETPVRIPAPAPEAHIEPEPAGDWYLQTSPELCMKRLLAQGYTKIFQICKCFRRHERGERHLPEMTMLEWYRADAGYRELMADCEGLFAALATPERIAAMGGALDFTPPWPRLTLTEAFRRYAPVSLAEAIVRQSFEEILVSTVEPRLGAGSPVFLCDYPASQASLARLHPDNAGFAERFELYCNGVELANGFAELNDPAEQRRRFEHEQDLIRTFGRTPAPMPEPFLDDLVRMPEAAGIALGVDRLVMLLTGASSIAQVVAFPPERL